MKIEQHGTVIKVAVASGAGVAERFMAQYVDAKWDNSDKRKISAELAKFQGTPTAKEVSEIIGNKSWTHPYCAQHSDYVDRAVIFGEGVDTVTVCEKCLRAAIAALTNAD